ncbi:hypothetical protein VA7868_03930 [Vibrio aerogenes CECT 7868]|uniref:Uncharacterized protein n=1 Tax=Vibrio aerogenes CECT 7868 TaxID=1216006 RepID=A0A1M6C2J8_9VIBR|nr:hypothetical protein [Vibrio aerogenes]SHI55230.1 hypothetical protein VA7868_03930 [Vibrio aerogenes CECT 7868]
MDSIFVVLYACLESNYVNISFFRQWSERLIGLSTCPKDWLISLTTASSEDEVSNVLRDCLLETGEILGDRYNQLLLGFLYLAYQKQLISPEKFVGELIDVVDAADMEIIGCGNILVEPTGTMSVENVDGCVLEVLKQFAEDCSRLFKRLDAEVIYEKEKEIFEQ